MKQIIIIGIALLLCVSIAYATTVTQDAKRMEYGKEITALTNRCISSMTNYKVALDALAARTAEMEADADVFTAEDVAEANAIRIAMAVALAENINVADADFIAAFKANLD